MLQNFIDLHTYRDAMNYQLNKRMSYELLEQAPKDHNSTAFINFLRENNTVVHENAEWLVIENCKYHNKEGNKKWHTAFLKSNRGWTVMNELHYSALKSVIEKMRYEDWELRIKRLNNRTVKRLHVHFIE